MKKILLLSLTFLFFITLPVLKSETMPAPDDQITQEVIDQAAEGLSAFDALDNIDIETINQLENTQPQPQVTWKMKWLGMQAEVENFISKHKIACGALSAGAVATIALIIIIIVANKNKSKP